MCFVLFCTVSKETKRLFMSFVSLGVLLNNKKKNIPSRKLASMITVKLSYRIIVVMSSLSCFFLFWWKLTDITLTLKKSI